MNHLGFLIIRVGIGTFYAIHGLHKLVEGKESLTELGKSFTDLAGISLPAFSMGLLAAVSQLLSGILISTGYKVKWGVFIGIPPLIIAAIILIINDDPFSHYSHSLELIIVLTGLGLYERNKR